MRKLIIILFLLAFPIYVFAGETINPHTGNLDVIPDVQEEDGDPVCYAPLSILVANDHLTCNADGTASISIDDLLGDVIYETELDTFSELQTQIADKTLVNEEDAPIFDSLVTCNAGLSVGGALQSSIVEGLQVNTGQGADADDDFQVHTDIITNAFHVDSSTEEIYVKVPIKNADDGKLLLGGAGQTHNEVLTLDFETYENMVSLDSPTGLGTLRMGTLDLLFPDGEAFTFGTSYDAAFRWQTVGNDNLAMGLKLNNASYSGYYTILEYADMGHANRSPDGTTAYPTQRIYSPDETEADDYVEAYHDGTNGVIDVGNGSLAIPAHVSCSGGLETDASGIISCHTDDDVPEVGDFDALVGGRSLTYDAGNDQQDADAELYTQTKCLIIETPTSADNFIMHHVELGAQITAVHCIVEDATSATIEIEQCDVAGDSCTVVTTALVCDVGGQADDGTIDNPDLDIDDWVRMDVTATSGTPGHVTGCFTMEMDD